MFSYKICFMGAAAVALTTFAGAAGYTSFSYMKTIELPKNLGGTEYVYDAKRLTTNSNGDLFFLGVGGGNGIAGRVLASDLLAAIKEGTVLTSGDFIGSYPNSHTGIFGLSAYGTDICYFSTYQNYATYKSVYTGSSWSIDTNWGKDGSYFESTYPTCAAMSDGRLVLGSSTQNNYVVLDRDGVRLGSLDKTDSPITILRPRFIAAKGDNTVYSYVGPYSGTTPYAFFVQKIVFDPLTLKCTAECKELPSTYVAGNAYGSLAYAAKDGYGIVVAANNSTTVNVMDEDLNSLQVITDVPAAVAGVAVVSDGSTGQYLILIGSYGYTAYVYERSTVPVTLSGFELE